MKLQKASEFKGYSLEMKTLTELCFNNTEPTASTARESATYTQIDSFVQKL
ncbi:hypothetical protein [Chryseobacterium indoltheticum]|uniref:hypothetical protein n=1 Tax=Chryseobacterium indoltheticum TaxID=254 RepID=UPI003F4934A1